MSEENTNTKPENSSREEVECSDLDLRKYKRALIAILEQCDNGDFLEWAGMTSNIELGNYILKKHNIEQIVKLHELPNDLYLS